eukprot:1022945-Pelagomonas_calceolata.AAC.1
MHASLPGQRELSKHFHAQACVHHTTESQHQDMGTVSSREGDSPLILAAKSGDALAAAQILRTTDHRVNHRGVVSKMALCSSGIGHATCCVFKECLAVCSQKWTPLMVAMYNSNLEVSRLILQHPEVDVNARDKFALLSTYALTVRMDTIDARCYWWKQIDGADAAPASSCGRQRALTGKGWKKSYMCMPCKPSGLTALTESAFGGFADVVQALLRHPDIRVNCTDQ